MVAAKNPSALEKIELIEVEIKKEQDELLDLVSKAEQLSKLVEYTMECIDQKQRNITMLEKLKTLSKV